MAIRNDFSIDWNQSPRIIIIASPSIECTMQDLLDTLRYMEAETSAMDNKPIVDASGKEVLDETTKVGITVTLQNAIIGFEARPGPDWVVCSFVGGNLVSVNTAGQTIQSIHPTAYVTIKAQSSSSATLQEQDALQYASYGGVVSVDRDSPYSGTAYPVGNMEYPVNNIQDAVSIGGLKGFDNLYIRGNYDLGAGDNITRFTLVGQNPTNSYITIAAEAIVLDCTIFNAKISGILDGGATLKTCLINGLSYVNGYLVECAFTEEPIVLGGGAQANMLSCYSIVAGSATPTIDFGGSGQSLVVRGYSGGFKAINKTGLDPVSVDFESGHFFGDATCTNGVINVRGSYKLTDNVTPPCVINVEGRTAMHDDIPTPEENAQATWDYVI